MDKKKAFTLAEIMIALVVIGVITSILLPVAFNNVPNENAMKFKKGNATLAKVINELVTSGEYYQIGDLGIKANGELITGENDDDFSNFCLNFADILTTKEVHCAESKTRIETAPWDTESSAHVSYGIVCSDWKNEEKESLDTFCKEHKDEKTIITTTDGITFYQTSLFPTFGYNKYTSDSPRLFKETIQHYRTLFPQTIIDESENAYRCKKVFCMDIDGINKGEDPFGYGIRVDGKILTGKRADEWMEKSIQEK